MARIPSIVRLTKKRLSLTHSAKSGALVGFVQLRSLKISPFSLPATEGILYLSEGLS